MNVSLLWQKARAIMVAKIPATCVFYAIEDLSAESNSVYDDFHK